MFGVRARIKSTTKLEYASNPSASHPISGKSLKTRLVAAESLAIEASSNCRLNISKSRSRARWSVSAGGSGNCDVGYKQIETQYRFTDIAHTTADFAKAPLITSAGIDMARAQ